MLPAVVFIVLFIAIVNRWWILTFISSLNGSGLNGYDLKDSDLIHLVYKKTGVKLFKIKILDTQKVWGLMGGASFKPYMVIAKSAYESFTKEELEWLLFHEAAHHVLKHGFKQVLLHIIFILGGVLLLQKVSYSLLLSPFVAMMWTIVYIQIVRRFEYEANTYALRRMKNPMAVVHIQQMAKKRWTNNTMKMDSMRQKLFSVWTGQIYQDLVTEATLLK